MSLGWEQEASNVILSVENMTFNIELKQSSFFITITLKQIIRFL